MRTPAPKNSKPTAWIVTLALAAAAGLPAASLAQEPRAGDADAAAQTKPTAAPPGFPSPPRLSVDPIVVTTRRTEEALADVPGSVAVLDDEALEKANAQTADQVLLRLPNVSFTENSTPGDLNLSIRGLGNLVGNGASAPANGVFLDGVLLNPTSSNTAINPRLLDLERVEVAYGPQGTAFGRGTIGGVINFVPKAPSDFWEAEWSGEYGTFPDYQGRLMVNAPVLPDGLLSLRAVGFYHDSDGFIDRPLLDDMIERREWGGRLSARSKPFRDLTLDLSASYDVTDFDDSNTINLERFEAGRTEVLSGTDGERDELQRSVGTARLRYDAPFGTFTSTSSHIRTRLEIAGDSDRTALDLTVGSTLTRERSWAQELRFESEAFSLIDGALDVSVNLGAQYSDSRFRTSTLIDPNQDAFDLVVSLILPGGGLIVNDDGGTVMTPNTLRVNNLSFFGDVRFDVFEDLELVAGLRYSRDDVRLTSEIISTGLISTGLPPLLGPIFPPQPEQMGDEIFSDLTPSASIRYRATEDLSLYVRYATGYRPGGFSPLFGGIQTFDEERAQSFEAGFRASWAGGRVRLNGNGYYIDYDDIQVLATQTVGIGVESFISNAARARSIGAEISLITEPVEGLVFQIDYGTIHAEFLDFENSPFGDLTGDVLPNAPEHTVSVVGEYQLPYDVLPFETQPFARVEYSYRDEFRNLLDPSLTILQDFDVLNVRVGLRGQRFNLEFFGENLLDELYATGTTSAATASFLGLSVDVDIARTRRYGVRVRIPLGGE